MYQTLFSQNAFSLHNTMLDERPIKIQLSEAGKKKSANKKNIIKQKNRKLSEMRNEVTTSLFETASLRLNHLFISDKNFFEEWQKLRQVNQKGDSEGKTSAN